MKELKSYVLSTFGYDVTGLGAYVDQERNEILSELIQRADTISKISVMENVKGSAEIKLIASDVTLAAAASCGWSASGGAVLTDKTMTVKRVKINHAYCMEDLVDTWGQIALEAGAKTQDEKLAFADVLIALYQKALGAKVEKLVWLGDTASLDADLLHIDGFFKILSADTAVTQVNQTVGTGTTFAITAITNANGMTILKSVVDALPAETIDSGNAAIFVGRETYRKALSELYDDNNNYVIDEDAGRSFIVPTSNVRVFAVNGLNGTQAVFAGPTNFMFFGTDLMSDFEGIKVWYDESADLIKVDAKMRVGAQYVFGDKFRKFTV
jgi:hypothetical protein